MTDTGANPHRQACNHLHISVIAAGLLSMGFNAVAHPGRVDENGGHNDGSSYHCHASQCEIPYSFTRGSYRSIFETPTERDKFFNPDDWPFDLDFDGDCQSTRNEILVATSTVTVRFTNPRNCEVRSGRWVDEYTGQEFTVAAPLRLDHIIPLKYAHNHGGDAWSPNKRVAFANDPLNLVLSGSKEIRRKRNRGPNRYLPREEYHCDYARQWQTIADKYEISLPNQDRNRIDAIMKSCP